MPAEISRVKPQHIVIRRVFGAKDRLALHPQARVELPLVGVEAGAVPYQCRGEQSAGQRDGRQDADLPNDSPDPVPHLRIRGLLHTQ